MSRLAANHGLHPTRLPPAEIGGHMPKGQVLVVEPPFHVSKSVFDETIRKARNAGFTLIERPKVLLSKTAVLKKG